MGISFDRDFTIGTGQPAAGQNRFCRNIVINNDELAEGPEQFTYELLSLNNALVMVNPTRSTAVVEIQDDDGNSV